MQLMYGFSMFQNSYLKYITEEEVPGLTVNVLPLSSGPREGLQLTVTHPKPTDFRNGCILLSGLISNVYLHIFYFL